MKEDDQVLQVIKMDDGNIMEFKNPLLVKNLLVNHPSSYVGIFKEATHPLPLEYKLKIGKIYYLLPRGGTDDDHEEHQKIEAPAKRIKVVITKAQLQQLIAKQSRCEELVISKVNIEPKKDCSLVVLMLHLLLGFPSLNPSLKDLRSVGLLATNLCTHCIC